MSLDISYLLLTVQGALLGNVVPSLRAVTVDFDEEILTLHFFYDAPIDDEMFDLASCTKLEVEPYPDRPYTGQWNGVLAIYHTFPKKIPIQGRLVYLRKEPMFPEYTQERASQLWPQKLPILTLLLDIQQALLGKITPALRSVSISLEEGKKLLSFYFYYDGEISAQDRESMSGASREASVSFPDFSMEHHIFRVDWPEKTPDEGQRIAYRRKEEYPELPKPILTRRETIVLKAKSLRSFLRRKWYNFWLKKWV